MRRLLAWMCVVGLMLGTVACGQGANEVEDTPGGEEAPQAEAVGEEPAQEGS